jgi:hypothetical protein
MPKTTKVRMRPDFVGPRPGWCPDPDKHEGLRTSMADMKQHMTDVHGVIYEEVERPPVRKTCPTCHGGGWIEA